MYLISFLVWVALTAGCFIWQAFGPHEWGKAAERSFFQGLAIALLLVVLALNQYHCVH